MQTAIGVGNGLHLLPGAAGGGPLDAITSDSGAYGVAALREVSGAITDQTGGGRHMLLPGGSADPLLLDHDGTDYFYLPGTSGNYLSVPDSAALDVTGDLEIALHLNSGDYSPASTQVPIGKYDGVNQRAWIVYLNTNGTLTLYWSSTGSNLLSATSSAALTTVAASGDLWVKITLDVDNGASGRDVEFFTASDGATWTQLGATQTAAGATSVHASTYQIHIGAQTGSSNFWAGRIYRAIVKDGIDGTTVLDVRASDADPNSTTFDEASSNAAEVTINQSSSGYKLEVVDQTLYAFATDDYLYADDDDVFDITASDDFTAGLVVRVHGTPGADYALLTKKSTVSGTDAGWSLQHATSGKIDATLGDGSAAPNALAASATTDHKLHTAAIVRDSTTVGAYNGAGAALTTASDTTSSTLANSQQVRIGSAGGGADHLNGVVVGWFFLTGDAKTATDTAAIGNALITLNGGTP